MRWRSAKAWTPLLAALAYWPVVAGSQIQMSSRTISSTSEGGKSSSQAPTTSALNDQVQRRTRWPGNKVVVPDADQSFLTRPAAFGPGEVDEDGLWGTMIPIQKFLCNDSQSHCRNTGCPREAQALWIENTETSSSFLKKVWPYRRESNRPPADWIALVERGDCSFEEKVRTAQRMGAQAVIVGDEAHSYDPFTPSVNLREWEDDEMEPKTRPITMYPDGDAKDIVIPSCFVIRSSYLDLMEYMRQSEQGQLPSRHQGVRVGLFLDASVSDTPWLDLGLAFFLLPSLFALFAVVSHHVRAFIKRYRDRASLHAVRSLPCFEWHPNCAWVPIKPEDVPGAPTPDMVLRGMQAVDTLYAWVVGLFSRRHDERDALMTHMEQAEYDTFSLEHQSMEPTAQLSRWYLQDACPICLIDFTEGFVVSVVLTHRDTVRVLPCGHIYHQQEMYVYATDCSDNWLTGTRRLCPTCKHDMTEPSH